MLHALLIIYVEAISKLMLITLSSPWHETPQKLVNKDTVIFKLSTARKRNVKSCSGHSYKKLWNPYTNILE
jgi:hypothetical protein